MAERTGKNPFRMDGRSRRDAEHRMFIGVLNNADPQLLPGWESLSDYQKALILAKKNKESLVEVAQSFGCSDKPEAIRMNLVVGLNKLFYFFSPSEVI